MERIVDLKVIIDPHSGGRYAVSLRYTNSDSWEESASIFLGYRDTYEEARALAVSFGMACLEVTSELPSQLRLEGRSIAAAGRVNERLGKYRQPARPLVTKGEHLEAQARLREEVEKQYGYVGDDGPYADKMGTPGYPPRRPKWKERKL